VNLRKSHQGILFSMVRPPVDERGQCIASEGGRSGSGRLAGGDFARQFDASIGPRRARRQWAEGGAAFTRRCWFSVWPKSTSIRAERSQQRPPVDLWPAGHTSRCV